jgi:uncharacterized protein
MLRPAALVAAIALVGACSAPPPDDSKYLTEIAAARGAKDAFFRTPDSPIPADRQSHFLPLPYYPADPAYAVPAAFKENPAQGRPRVELQTSGKERRQMELVGVLEFTVQGRALRLSAFVEAGEPPDKLFVPFTDETTGTETYSAGRYLEIDRSPTGIYVVDFNRAFNPYCAYNPTYDCPYPPRENRLAAPIRAGERAPK